MMRKGVGEAYVLRFFRKIFLYPYIFLSEPKLPIHIFVRNPTLFLQLNMSSRLYERPRQKLSYPTSPEIPRSLLLTTISIQNQAAP